MKQRGKNNWSPIPESLIVHDSSINSASKDIRYLSIGLFTAYLAIKRQRIAFNFIGIITVSSHFFEITCSVALSFLKTVFVGPFVTYILRLLINLHKNRSHKSGSSGFQSVENCYKCVKNSHFL